MAFSSTNPPVAIGGSFYTGTESPRGAVIWLYVSTHASTAVGNVTGFFTKSGAGGNPKSTDATAAINMRVGDLLINCESTAGSVPGRVSWHSVIGSTADNASTSASTGFNSCFDVTVSSS